MKDLYPNMKVVPSSSSNLLTKLAEGECDAAVVVQDSFAIQKRLKKYNEDCNMHKTGDMIYPASAGWAVASDSGIKCTSIIRDAIDIYMVLALFPSSPGPPLSLAYSRLHKTAVRAVAAFSRHICT